MLNEVNPQVFIETLALELQSVKLVAAPDWAAFVRTGPFRQRPPVRKDWWFVRAAAIFRAIAISEPIGVSKLRVRFGGKQNRGYKPPRFCRASGKIIRLALQQLEAAGFIKQVVISGHKGRALTKQGKLFLNTVLKKVVEEQKAKSG